MSNILRAMSDGTSYNIIVKSYLSYDGGVPIGGHTKLRLRLRMCCAHASYIYLIYTYINIYNDMYGVPSPPARGQQQQLSMHLEHEILHSHDGHAQEVHPHDLHVVASGHAHLSGPQASQSFGQHVIVAGRSEVRRGMAKRGCPRSVGRTSAVGRMRGPLAPRGLCV